MPQEVIIKDKVSGKEAGVTSDGKLKVQANVSVGDVTIGSVKLEDGDSTTKADIGLDTSNNALYVQSDSLSKESKQDDIITQLSNTFPGTLKFGESDIATANEIALVTYTVPAGKKYRFFGIMISGDGAGKFRLEIDSSDYLVMRNSWASRTVTSLFDSTYEIAAASVVKVYALNKGSSTNHYEVTLYGSEQDV